ncbi:xanthine dehydrogenase family protein molybdopterin-binding subunit [Acidaminobacter sp. JC074]|uniref:xanthine dehydrogenase family protein molybdopterin-binding subunit n=1 Tax=Acidaminobacter sp. JC074 TaxID=2530199 RepID=UPI001F0D732C|nr:molybdopterin cofactor-binding domain-containing protein [Acidaminobacter sp. JC074]MCH4886141.1 xanthine dehydrogenase family protein molybdopterin-binding subunit [Acidaminobacter sp. JC074]
MTKTERKYVGKSYPIHDAKAKACGRQKYLPDMKFSNLLHAKVLFSSIPHGIVKKIDTSKAEALDGVVKVFTPFNTTKKCFNSYITNAGETSVEDERIFTDRVRFVGDRIAAVVAKDKHTAKRAIDLIEVEYEELPALPTLKEALESDTSIHEGGNILSEADLSIGQARSKIDGSKHSFNTSVHTQKVHHAAMENHSAVVLYNEMDEMTVYAPCQSVYSVRNTIAGFLEKRYSDITVIKTTMGGSFGGKQQVILELVCAYMANDLKANVSLQYNRKETILSTVTGTAIDYDVSLGFDENHQLEGIEISSLVDSGAYCSNSVALNVAGGKKLYRVYDVDDVTYKGKVVYTNGPISGGFRGWGCPQIYTALEIAMTNAARELKVSPVDIRLKNMVSPGSMEKYSNLSLGNARPKDVMLEGAKAFDFENRYNKKSEDSRYKKGVGLAAAGHVNGYYGKVQDHSSIIMKMSEDGSVIINSAGHEQGCGTLISFAIIAAEVLDTPVESIKVMEANTSRSPFDLGTFSSRVTYVTGRAVKNAAEKLKDLVLEKASRLLNKPVAYLYIKDGVVHVKGNAESSVSYGDICIETHRTFQEQLQVTETYQNTSNPGGYGVHFAEVEVDTLTGLIRVTDYLASHDVGTAINHGMIEGQIHGGVQMGIGYALSEDIKLNDKGYPVARNFSSYHVVNTPDMPKVRTLILEYGQDDGPFGAKAIGEIAATPVMAAVVNAVNHALDSDFSSLPITPEKVIAKLNSEV